MPATAGKYGSKDSLTPSGREKTRATREQREAAELQAEISKDLYESTRGLRGSGIRKLSNFIDSGILPFSIDQAVSGTYRTGRQDLESQYRNARQDILNQIPVRGGQLNDSLTNLALQRADSIGNLRANIASQIELPLRTQLFGQALGIGFGQPPIALSGLSASGSQHGQIAARSQAEQLEREARSKEEVQQIAQAASFAFGT